MPRTRSAAAKPEFVQSLVMPSPLGPLRLVAGRDGLRSIHYVALAPEPKARRGEPGREAGAALLAARRQLEEYFAGRRRRFTLRLAKSAGTAFQRAVWAALRRIPYGATASYGEIAARVGRPGAARAVGGANRANPWPIVVPCHRVIGANGALTGYSGRRGLPLKARLLQHESAR